MTSIFAKYDRMSTEDLVTLIEAAGGGRKPYWSLLRFGNHYKAFLGIPDRMSDVSGTWLWLKARPGYPTMHTALAGLLTEIERCGWKHANIELIQEAQLVAEFWCRQDADFATTSAKLDAEGL